MTVTRRELVVVALAALFAAAALHAPLWAALGEAIPGEAGSDAYRGHWSLWLLGAELFDWTFSTERVNFPTGVSLLPFPAVTLMLAAPLSRLFGPDIALPLMVGGYTALAVVGGWALARALGARLGGGLLAAALIASQPVLGGALRDGTLEVLAVGWYGLRGRI